MDNVHCWTNQKHWKCPQTHNAKAVAFKKKSLRKKKKPVPMDFSVEGQENAIRSFNIAPSKRKILLSGRTMKNCRMNCMNKDEEDSVKEEESHEPADPETGTSNIFSDPPHAESSSNEYNDAQESTIPAETESAQCDFPDIDTAELDSVELDTAESEAAEPGATQPDSAEHDTVESDSDTAQVKVEPIRCVNKPSRVDFQHLKAVMLEVILEKLEELENVENQDPEAESSESPATLLLFRDVLYELFNSDRLHYRTKKDLSVAISFLGLLTVAHENNFFLHREENSEMEDIQIGYTTPEMMTGRAPFKRR